MPIKRDVRPVKFATHPNKISTGYGVPNEKSPNGVQPKSADHFVVAHPQSGEVYFPEIIDLYGSEPKELYITFPSDNYNDFYKEDFKRWGGNKSKVSVCDGETCTFYFDYDIGNNKYKANGKYDCPCKSMNLKDTEDERLKKKACRVDSYLTMMILNPNILFNEDLPAEKRISPISPLCYIFENHSIHTADNIFSELDRYKKLAGYPFVLSVKKIKGNNLSYPLTQLAPFVTSKMLIDYNIKMEEIALQNPNQLGNGKDFLLEAGKQKVPDAQETIKTPVIVEKPVVTKEQILEKNKAKQTDGKNIFELPSENGQSLYQYYMEQYKTCMSIEKLNELNAKVEKDSRLSAQEKKEFNVESDNIRGLIIDANSEK